MKMKKLLVVTAVSATFFVPLSAHADDLLTGDARLACEAILCLSSAERPNECAESLHRYFSIKLKKPYKTIQARKDFLNLCPSSREPNMSQLVNALAKGAGRCDAAELNKIGHYVGLGQNRRFVVSKTKPSYCAAYENHEWTTVKTELQTVYCTRMVRSIGAFGGSLSHSQPHTEKYACGHKWVDVK